MSETVLMRCTRKGCPRTKRIPKPEDVPARTAEIHSLCPWHHEEGDTESYFDNQGRELSYVDEMNREPEGEQ